MRHNRFLFAAAMATALTVGLAACSTPANNARVGRVDGHGEQALGNRHDQRRQTRTTRE